ncbi:hypothetical protein AAC387_Pa06g0305 [Persea americana]
MATAINKRAFALKGGVVKELQLDSAPWMEELHLEILVIYDHQPPMSTSIVGRPTAPLIGDLWELDVVIDSIVRDTEEASKFLFFFCQGILFFYFYRYGIEIGIGIGLGLNNLIRQES